MPVAIVAHLTRSASYVLLLCDQIAVAATLVTTPLLATRPRCRAAAGLVHGQIRLAVRLDGRVAIVTWATLMTGSRGALAGVASAPIAMLIKRKRVDTLAALETIVLGAQSFIADQKSVTVIASIKHIIIGADTSMLAPQALWSERLASSLSWTS